MCLVCNHEEPPDGGFRSSYICGLLFGTMSAEAGGPGVLNHVIEGFCEPHRRMWTFLDQAFARTGTARFIAARRAKKMVISEACVAAIRIIAEADPDDIDAHGIARAVLEAESAHG